MEPTKRCTSCLRVLSIVNFHKDKTGDQGVRGECKECRRQRTADRHSTKEGRARRSASVKRYRRSKKAEETNQRYIERRVQLRSQATPPWCDLAQVAAVYAEAERLTVESGVRHEVHHIYPIMEFSALFVGLHVPWNLEILPADEHTEAHVELRRKYAELNAKMKKV
jgi:hypothetical protein